jgi:hypothetical protein
MDVAILTAAVVAVIVSGVVCAVVRFALMIRLRLSEIS